MRLRTYALGLTLAIVATVASASSLPPPGEVWTYYESGVQVGRAVHNQCTGKITVQGRVTNDHTVGYVHC